MHDPTPPLILGGQGRSARDMTRDLRLVRFLVRAAWRLIRRP